MDSRQRDRRLRKHSLLKQFGSQALEVHTPWNPVCRPAPYVPGKAREEKEGVAA